MNDLYELYFWRTQGGSEVDFVLYGERGLIAIEVKHAGVVRERDLRGLRTFVTDYPMAKQMLVYLGIQRERRGEVDVLPATEFLRELPALLAW